MAPDAASAPESRGDAAPFEPRAHGTDGGRIPVTVIGGFLGSGKTTLLNRLLAHADGLRLAVLVNDFGALNIDAALVESRNAGIVNLSNGCVCCQIGDDLSDALMRVIDAPEPPDAIVIEASGVSDPWRIGQVALVDPALALDAVVVLVDATMIEEMAADPLLGDTTIRQLQAADLLVVNHCDRMPADALAALGAALERMAPGTPRIETRFAELPPALLGRRAATSGAPHPGEPPPPGPFGHGAVFESWSATDVGRYRSDALRQLLRSMPPGVLRFKGMLRTERAGWWVIQFAGRHGSLRAWSSRATPPADDAPNAWVAIGARGRLPVASLQSALAAARCADEPAGAPPVA